ncbi:hypothetical protein [Maribacter sp.]|nr:hypothetical protein [Maribacter sp.]
MKFTVLEIFVYVNLAITFMVILVIGSGMYMQRRNSHKEEIED